MTDTVHDHDDKESINEFSLGSLKKILLQVENNTEIEELNREIAELNVLSERLSKHTYVLLDNVEGKDSPEDSSKPMRLNSTPKKPKISQAYVCGQVGNLLSLKQLKATLLKQKNDLKASSLDRAFKIVNQLDKNKEGGDSGIPLDAVFSFLLESGITLPVSNEKGIVVNHQDEGEIDREIELAMEANNVKAIEVPKKESIDTLPTKIFFDDEAEKFYLVDDSYNIIKEVEEESLEIIEKDSSFWSVTYGLPVVEN